MLFIRSIVALLSLVFIFPALADTWVDGYTRKDGTKVKGHYRSDRDSNKSNNWSTKGNVNPHTGERGTQPGGFSGAHDTPAPAPSPHNATRSPQQAPPNPYGGYQATPYVRRGPPKAKLERLDKDPNVESEEKARENSRSSTDDKDPPEAKKPKRPKVEDDHEVYCSMRLREYHWRYDCSLLKKSKPVPLTIKSVRTVGYAECIQCRPGTEPDPNTKDVETK